MARAIAEIANESLSFLASQHLPPTPSNYALAYHSLSKPKSAIGLAVAAIIDGGVRIRQDEVRQLISLHSDMDLSKEGDAHRSALRHQTIKLGEAAAEAAALTGAFAHDLAAEALGIDGTLGQTAQAIARMVARSRLAETQLSAAAMEIEGLRQKLEAAQDDAEKDLLTGLGNRRAIERHLKELAQTGLTSTIAVCDIDYFKRVNDRYGHGVGDRVLKLVADSLADSCAPHFVGRWGGEEFLVVMAGIAEKDCAEKVDHARKNLAKRELKLRETDEPLGAITFSAGVASVAGDYAAHVSATHRADAALYSAKLDGRNRVVRA